MAEVPSTPGERLKWARESAGYASAKEFQNAFGLKQGTYAGHESGSRGIRPDAAKEYASYLKNCSPEWILYGHGEAPPMAVVAARPTVSNTRALGRRQEEEEAFALLYNSILQITQENDETLLREFGVALERYGFEGNLKGVGKLAFHLFKEAQEEGGAMSLKERVLKRASWLEDAMSDLKESLRKMGNLIGPTV